jgi:hypothetical protein
MTGAGASVFALLVGNVRPQPPWPERGRRFGGKRTLPMPVFAQRTPARGHFTLRGHMAENGTRRFREDHGDD